MFAADDICSKPCLCKIFMVDFDPLLKSYHFTRRQKKNRIKFIESKVCFCWHSICGRNDDLSNSTRNTRQKKTTKKMVYFISNLMMLNVAAFVSISRQIKSEIIQFEWYFWNFFQSFSIDCLCVLSFVTENKQDQQ